MPHEDIVTGQGFDPAQVEMGKEIVVGQEFGPIQLELDSGINQRYLDAIENNEPIYVSESSCGGPILHPIALINNVLPRLWIGQFFRPDQAALHAKEETEFLNPVRVGERIEVKMKVADKYIKRGREYFVCEFTYTDEKGTAILRTKSVTAIGVSEGWTRSPSGN